MILPLGTGFSWSIFPNLQYNFSGLGVFFWIMKQNEVRNFLFVCSGTVFMQFNYFRQKYLAVMAATADEGRQVPLTKSCKMQKITQVKGCKRVQKGAKDWTFYQIFYILSQWLQRPMKAGRKVSLGVPLSPAASLVGDIGDVQQMTKNLSTRIPNSSLKYTLKETCIWEIFRMNFYFQDRLIACQTL